MGADIYLRSRYDADDHEKWVNDAIKLYGSAVAGAAEVGYFKGYFHDTYNRWSLFSRVGLSWQEDVLPKLTDDFELPIDTAQELLWRLFAVCISPITPPPTAIERLLESEFRDVGGKIHEPKSPPPPVSWYETKRSCLAVLLRESIELNEPLWCSL